MLITLIHVIGCENPRCREFARIVSDSPGKSLYYCPVCGGVSLPRTVPESIAVSPQRYEAYLRGELAPARKAGCD
jgi:hypothetical protein